MSEPRHDTRSTDDRLDRLEQLLIMALTGVGRAGIAGTDPRNLLNIGGGISFPSPEFPSSPFSSGFSGGFPRVTLEEIVQRLAAITEENSQTKEALRVVYRSYKRVSEELAELREDHRRLRVKIEESPLFSEAKIVRSLDVSVYLSDEDGFKPPFQHVLALLSVLNLEVTGESEPEISSWFKKIAAQTKDVVTSQEVRERLEKVEEAIELRQIELVKAERDHLLSQAALNVAQALEKQSSGLVIIGSLVVLKCKPDGSDESVLLARTLTRQQQDEVERNPILMRRPEAMYNLLMDARGSSANASLEGPDPDALSA